MTVISERQSVCVYLKKTLKRTDGKVWLLTCIVSVIAIFDVLTGMNLIPLRDIDHPEKAIVLLLLSPLILFLFLVFLRQLPFRGNKYHELARCFLCIFLFLVINF